MKNYGYYFHILRTKLYLISLFTNMEKYSGIF